MIVSSVNTGWLVLSCDAPGCGAQVRASDVEARLIEVRLAAAAFTEGWALDRPGVLRQSNHYCPDHIDLVKEER